MTTFVLPDLGEGLQEAELVAWHVGEGDHVVADQPLVSVETEKAVVEVPSPQDGKIARLRVKPGDRVKVGAPLVEFEEGPRTDTGTIVGELAAARRNRFRRQYRQPRRSRRLRRSVLWRSGSGWICPKLPRADPAARSPAPMSSAPPARRPRPHLSSRSPGCAARWL